MFLLLIGLYYFNARVLVPRLLHRQKLVKFFFVHIIIAVLFQIGNKLLNRWVNVMDIVEKAIEDKFQGKFHITLGNWSVDTTLLLTSCLLVGISTSIAVVQIWQKDLLKNQQLQLRSQQLQKQQLDSELSFLKAQMHPHFFFNTLNNIYSLTYTDVENSRVSLHKLSRMMRYLLYETQTDYTSLHKEIDFVKDYIELMQLRLNGNTSIQFEEPAIITEKSIAPMMLLPFVENAFKHGVSSILNGRILVKIEQVEHMLIFEVENTYFANRKIDIDDGGIGLANTKRRLDLIYPENHQLIYGRKDEDKYLVHLELSL